MSWHDSHSNKKRGCSFSRLITDQEPTPDANSIYSNKFPASMKKRKRQNKHNTITISSTAAIIRCRIWFRWYSGRIRRTPFVVCLKWGFVEFEKEILVVAVIGIVVAPGAVWVKFTLRIIWYDVEVSTSSSNTNWAILWSSPSRISVVVTLIILAIWSTVALMIWWWSLQVGVLPLLRRGILIVLMV